MEEKSNVLVICSEAAEDYGGIVQEELEYLAYVSLEKQIIGRPMENKLERLLYNLMDFDYGIILLDDEDFKSYNREIIFLIGVLVGNLGLKHCTLLIPKNKNIGDLTKYLDGFQPNYYDKMIENKRISIAQGILNIKHALYELEDRFTEKDYKILENKKELLRIALECYGETTERYNPFLINLMNFFNPKVGFKNPKVIGATIFALKDDYFEQIGTAGIKANHRISLNEREKGIVKCHLNNELHLGEKVNRFYGDEKSYEYIFYTPLYNSYVLAIHIKCEEKIKNKLYEEKYLKQLEIKNAGYISILQLFLKGGSRIEEY